MSSIEIGFITCPDDVDENHINLRETIDTFEKLKRDYYFSVFDVYIRKDVDPYLPPVIQNIIQEYYTT